MPLCEVCGHEEAFSFSWFADRERWYEARSGTWKFTGLCTADTEHYYVRFHQRGDGFLDSRAAQLDWYRHLREKVWFDPLDFAQMCTRFEAAGGQLRPRRAA